MVEVEYLEEKGDKGVCKTANICNNIKKVMYHILRFVCHMSLDHHPMQLQLL